MAVTFTERLGPTSGMRTKWDMGFNSSKCQVVILTRTSLPEPPSKLSIYSIVRFWRQSPEPGTWGGYSNYVSWNTHVDIIALNTNRSPGLVKRNLKTKTLKSEKWHIRLLYVPSWSMFQLNGTPTQKKIPIKLK